MNIQIVCTGTELLLGHTLNSNLQFLGRTLDGDGYAVAREVCVPDGGEAIAGAVREARDYLLLHYAEPVTLDVLARVLSLSKYHLQKLFRRQVGQTPNEFLNDLRLNHAKEFLRATDEPVARIAEAVGFENASYFIRRFKRHEGVTPAVYRRRWQQE